MIASETSKPWNTIIAGLGELWAIIVLEGVSPMTLEHIEVYCMVLAIKLCV